MLPLTPYKLEVRWHATEKQVPFHITQFAVSSATILARISELSKPVRTFLST